ncbi:hypothetical protein E1262_19780 [Jiangella aurantiaca]|uniref:Uncharacterized protein n=1 Tax=Jiangella aurantiaca TaxID=2530373 RepID=A0A4R5A580_9ACTN|nr:hypothetical protein [Jiangella aurantiaca]TDD67178.1 hypothetical protein E1262_19780 [Jiangella aurantiaca]
MTIPPIFGRLIDDAAVFPPGDLPLADAVPAHVAHRSAWYSALVGPLLCPASSLESLASLARTLPSPLEVAVVVDTGTAGVLAAVDTVAQESHVVLRGVEVPLRGSPLGENARRTVAALDAALGGPDDDEPAYVEVPREPGWEQALDVVADAGYRAKLRTGGASPDAVPSDDAVAAFIVGCLDRGIPFKFTAGLHHAVRRPSEHGFLNMLVAAGTAVGGGAAADVAAALALDDGARLAATVAELPAVSVRRWFASYGSCSIAEPLAELIALGLVADPGKVAR